MLVICFLEPTLQTPIHCPVSGQGGLLVVHRDIGTILPSMEPLLHWATLEMEIFFEILMNLVGISLPTF
jgi:hypothetical protein